MDYLMLIPPDMVEATRGFFRDRGGVVLWKNCEIGVSRPDMMTPATHQDGSPPKPPHWAYGNKYYVLRPEEIGVREETVIVPPDEWFDKCDACKGSGRRFITELASARQETVKVCRERLIEANKDHPERLDMQDNGTIRCWACNAGVKDRNIRVAIRRKYWGLDISDTGKGKAQQICRKLAKLFPDPRPVHFDWQYDGWGRARLFFYRETITPFTLEDPCNAASDSSKTTGAISA